MAYKFQLVSAILSGSTKFEEEVDAAGGIKLSGVSDTALDVSADSFLFRDADGTMKRDTMADYATAIAGDGLAASSGVLAVGVDDSTVELNSDALRIKDSGVTAAKLNTDVISAQVELAHADIADADELMISDGGVLKKTGVDSLRDHFFGVVSGDATIADGGALTIAANAVEDSMVNDNVATGLAGVGLSAASGVMALDLNELTEETLASGDFFAFVDSTDNGTHKETVDDLATLFAGNGLAAASAVLSVDLNELSAAAVNVGADSIAIIDADDSNGSRKESIADLMTAVAGSGLKSEDGVLEVRVSGSIVRNSDKLGISGSIAGAGLSFSGGENSISSLAVGEITNGGIAALPDGVKLDLAGLAAASVDVANDSIAILDAGDSSSKKESVADLMTAVAGNGLAATSGVLSLDASEVPSAAIASGDHFVFHDVTDDSTKKETVDDLASFMAGVGLSATSGVLTLDIDEFGALGGASVDQADNFLFSDGGTEKKVTFSNLEDTIFGNVSGDATIAAGGALTIAAGAVEHGMLAEDIISGQAELAHADINDDDEMMIDDAGTVKKVGVDSLRDHFFGVVSGDATVADGGALTIAADAVESGMLNDNVISGQTDIGAAIADTDELLISDAGTLRRTDVSRLRAMPVAERGDGDTLASGMNFFGDLSSNATVSLPASPEVGDKVVAKAKGLTGAKIIINRQGSHTIDGATSVEIESPFGAVTCVYVNANDWRLI